MLVDQDRCRGWRMCVSGCPYKKVYFNHRTGKAEKCTFCFPRIEVGIPTVCSETCVGPAALHRPGALRRRQGARGGVDRRTSTTSTRRSVGVPRPRRPGRACGPPSAAGIPRDWIEAAQRSPIYALINTYRVALPLHPEYRTMPMVWYIPPLSPVVDVVKDTGTTPRTTATCSPRSTPCASRSSTSPSCSPPATSRRSTRCCKKLAAMRSYMRDINLGRDPDESIPAAVGHDGEQMYDMYRLLAIAKYDERYVIPPAHAEQAHALEELATECRLDYEGGPGMGGSGPFGEGSGGPTPIAVENFRMLQDRQTTDTLAAPSDKAARVNLLNWDGKGAPAGLFPDRKEDDVPRRRGRSAGPRPYGRCAAVLSVLLGYPDGGAGRPAAGPSCRGAGPRTTPTSHRLFDAPPRHGPGPPAAGLRRDVRPHPQVRASTSPTSPTATRASAAWRCCSSSRPTALRGSSSDDGRTSCPTTCAPCSSSPRPSTPRPAGGCSLDHRAGRGDAATRPVRLAQRRRHDRLSVGRRVDAACAPPCRPLERRRARCRTTARRAGSTGRGGRPRYGLPVRAALDLVGLPIPVGAPR